MSGRVLVLPSGGERVPDRAACGACALAPDQLNRRAFLHRVTVSVGGMLAAIAVSGERAGALPVEELRAAGGQSAGTRDTTCSYPIPDKDSVQIDREHQVILVRWLDVVYAFALSCPHQNTALTWLSKDERFQCPKHRSQYSADGYFISGRATRGMDRYSVTRSGQDPKLVVVDLDALKRESDDKDAWAAACVKLP